MNCANARRMISETLDGESLGAALSAHLAGCASCSRALARYRSLGAALVALPERRPSAGFNAAVLAALARRPAELPLAPLALSIAASSALAAWGASRLTVSPAGLAVGAGKFIAGLQMLGRLAALFLPAPRAGAEFASAAAVGAALFLAISLPHAVNNIRRPIGAKI
ncbi:MAG: anti-sigma factor family protein [Elusimicrobiota bacterium]